MGSVNSSAKETASLATGRRLFTGGCDFQAGVTTLDALPESRLPEIAFAGRSNVGKSSLLNALTARKTLARTSKTPGRTKQINLFRLGERLLLVDLPGYGYARASKRDVQQWTELVTLYLKGRVTLKRVLLLVDARHGLKESDRDLLGMLDVAGVSYQIVLTKTDKLKPEPLAARLREIEKEVKTHGAAHPEIAVTSAKTGNGIPQLRACLAMLA
ncbi:MAG: YihA family ribosome biogenesis GTP-binding protein [Alphaproteobacteria bacterium]|nr:YihA family ribosome biogenesis GTP-binding protein [Alphaproteobacteria bacterium]